MRTHTTLVRVLLLGVALLLITYSAAEAQVLFSDDFNDSPRFRYLKRGSWTVDNGVLRCSGSGQFGGLFHENAHWMTLSDPSWTDLQVDLDLQLEDGATFGFASYVSFQGATSDFIAKGYILQITAGRPGMSWSSVELIDTICSSAAETQQTWPIYEPGWHHLTIFITDEGMTVYLDGQEWIAFLDPSCSEDRSMIAIGARDKAPAIEIDNLVVQVPQPVQAEQGSWGRVKAERR